jgi:hypothetical protein
MVFYQLKLLPCVELLKYVINESRSNEYHIIYIKTVININKREKWKEKINKITTRWPYSSCTLLDGVWKCTNIEHIGTKLCAVEVSHSVSHITHIMPMLWQLLFTVKIHLTLKKLSCMCLYAFSQNYMFFLCNRLWGDTIQSIILKCSPVFLNLSSIYFKGFLNN